jgi:hypothetical protein
LCVALLIDGGSVHKDDYIDEVFQEPLALVDFVPVLAGLAGADFALDDWDISRVLINLRAINLLTDGFSLISCSGTSYFPPGGRWQVLPLLQWIETNLLVTL